MRFIHRCQLTACLIVVFALSPARQSLAQCDLDRILPAAAPSIYSFGNGLDVDGEWAAVGTAWDNNPNGSVGRVVMFRRQVDNSWTEIETLVPNDGQVLDLYGDSLTLDDRWLAVGSPRAAATAGAVYLYERIGDADWTFRQRITLSTPSYYFGEHLAMHGDFLVVTQRLGGGNAAVFRRSNGTWSLEATLPALAGDPTQADGVNQVTIDGSRVLVLSSYRFALMYARSASGVWSLESDLRSLVGEQVYSGSNGAAILGDLAVVGNLGDSDPFVGAGSAWVFRRMRSGTWQFEVELHASSPVEGHRFGRSVALSKIGDREILVVGAEHDSLNALWAGSATVFTREAGGTWRLRRTLRPPQSLVESLFGRFMAIDSNTVLVAAIGYDHPCPGNGAVFAFDLGSLTPADVNLDCMVNVSDLLGVIQAWGVCPAGNNSCPGDVTANGVVDVEDLLEVISEWGTASG